jgi:hypothetical protein
MNAMTFEIRSEEKLTHTSPHHKRKLYALRILVIPHLHTHIRIRRLVVRQRLCHLRNVARARARELQVV